MLKWVVCTRPDADVSVILYSEDLSKSKCCMTYLEDHSSSRTFQQHLRQSKVDGNIVYSSSRNTAYNNRRSSNVSRPTTVKRLQHLDPRLRATHRRQHRELFVHDLLVVVSCQCSRSAKSSIAHVYVTNTERYQRVNGRPRHPTSATHQCTCVWSDGVCW